MKILLLSHALVVLFPLLALAQEANRAVEPSEMNFAEVIKAGRAFRESPSRIQNVLLEISGLANLYSSVTEQDLIAMPEATAEEQPEGKSVHVTSPGANGTAREFRYNRQAQRLSWVRITHPDGSGVSVSLTRTVKPSRLALHAGYVSFAGGLEHVEIEFDAGSSQPRVAMTLVGKRPQVLVKGTVICWDGGGKQVRVLEVSEPQSPLGLMKTLISTATPDQLRAFGVPANQLLHTHAAYKQAEPELRRCLDNLVAWSERLLNTPEDALLTSLQGKEISKVENGTTRTYTIGRGLGMNDSLWTVKFDVSSGQIIRASYGSLQLYFDCRNPNRLIRGRGSASDKNSHWVVSFYSENYAPRIAIRTTTELSGSLMARGKYYIWGPTGKPIISKELPGAYALDPLLEEIDFVLKEDEKSSVSWRGTEQELAMLQPSE